MKALSLHSPWWWYIIHGYKDIENRSWPTKVRGRVLIHASKTWSGDSVQNDIRDIHAQIMEPGIVIPPRLSDLHPWGGYIVGSVEIVGCVTVQNSRWFFGPYGFVLRNPEVFQPPVKFKGNRLFFEVPDSTIAVVR